VVVYRRKKKLYKSGSGLSTYPVNVKAELGLEANTVHLAAVRLSDTVGAAIIGNFLR
jgi:hypothetical protein